MPHQNTRIPHQRIAVALTILVLASSGRLAAQATQPAQAAELLTREPEASFSGSVEAVNRWRWFSGNEDVYRSTINLGEGPKLSGLTATFSLPNSSHTHFLDRATVSASGWGGEPVSTLQFTALANNRYQLDVHYRHFDYFNSLPSFANPSDGRIGESQSTLDVNRRLADVRLTLRPEARVSPFLAFDRDSTRGPGKTDFVQDANEYSVFTNADNATSSYRGGVRLRFQNWRATIEGGGSRFHDNQSITADGRNLGNRTTLFLGQRLELDGLEARYDVSGSDRFVQTFAEVRPLEALTINGRFSFSQPNADTRYSSQASGLLVLLNTLQSFTGERISSMSTAKYPHPSGSISAEFRPIPRFRIIDTISFDRFHIHGESTSDESFTPSATLDETDASRLSANFTRQRIDAVLELTPNISVHAGHAYWSANATSPGSVLADSEIREIHRNQLDAGLIVKLRSRASIRADVEGSGGEDSFFRTDRRHFRSLNLRGEYEIVSDLRFGLATRLWNNNNRAPDIDFFQKSRELSADLMYTPGGGKWLAVDASYTRGTFRSDLPFIVPQNFQKDLSIYRDRGHNAALNVTLKPLAQLQAGIGGDLFVSTSHASDSSTARPTRFYNPHLRLSWRLAGGASWVGRWEWHEYSNRSLLRETYQAHLLSTGFEYRF